MKRVLISIDHKWRDLPGYVYLGSLLEKNGYSVEYVRNGLERYFIQGFRPNIVIINHLYDKKKQKYFNKVKEWGVKVVILPTEGIPTLAQYREFAAGVENDLSSVALHFLWNEPMREITAKNPTISKNKLQVVGVPRFDFYKSPLSDGLISKRDFIKKYRLKENLPIVTFATNFTQAQFAVKNKEFLESDAKKLGYDKIWQNNDGIQTIPQRDYNSRNTNIKAFIQLVKDLPDVNFVLKLHPSEDHTFYYKLLEKELKAYQDRVAVIVQEYIWDVLRASDVELKRSCTTGIESWILGRPTIEMGLYAYEWYRSPEHIVGSDIVASYGELKEVILQYLNGRSVGQDKQKNRKDFLQEWCYQVDGRSSERVASALQKIELQETQIGLQVRVYFMYILLHLTNYKVHDFKIFGIHQMLIGRRVDKLGRVDKYFNRHDIRKWKKYFKQAF